MSERILALDLGKSKSAACLQLRGEPGRVFRTVPTRPQDLHDLIVELEPDVVLVESSSIGLWVHDVAAALGKRVIVTATNGPGWKWKNVRVKTDRSDAVKMIKMYLSDQLEPVHVPARDVREWRGLIRYRHEAVRGRTAAGNRIRQLLARRAIVTPPKHLCWTGAYLEELDGLSRPLAECGPDELWRGMLHESLAMYRQAQAVIDRLEKKLDEVAARRGAVALLREERGVGARLAETIVAVIDDPLRFRRGKQVACYAGLTPRKWESGQTSRDGHISKQGHKLLRTLLVEVAWLGLRHNPWMRATYERIKKNTGKRGKLAIVAVARRLLVRLWARWRDHARATLTHASARPARA
jgi:transposase